MPVIAIVPVVVVVVVVASVVVVAEVVVTLLVVVISAVLLVVVTVVSKLFTEVLVWLIDALVSVRIEVVVFTRLSKDPEASAVLVVVRAALVCSGSDAGLGWSMLGKPNRLAAT